MSILNPWVSEEQAQTFLDVIAFNDKLNFLQGIENNWQNHRPMLLLGLTLTSGKVTEMGAGDGSTTHLRAFCEINARGFQSYESNEEWALKCRSYFVQDWDGMPLGKELYDYCGLLFIDHAPGEHRKVAIERMMDRADIIVVHDTEQGGAGDYGFEPVFSKFRYRLNYNKTGGGAGATAVSNKIDLNQFRGLSLGAYKFDND